MGRDKALIELGGKRIIDRISEAMSAAGSTRISAVVSQRSQLTEEIGLPVLYDKYENSGALAGIHAALSASRSPITFVSACDLPFANPVLIRRLVSLCENAGCAIPEQQDKRIQPLFAAYDTHAALSAAMDILSNERAGNAVNQLPDRLETRILRFEQYSDLLNSEYFLANINTPVELNNAEQMFDRANREADASSI